MKNIVMIYFAMRLSFPYAQAQIGDTNQTIFEDTLDLITSMDALDFSADNSVMFRIDIDAFLKRADSIIVSFDIYPHEAVFKKAIVYSSKSSRISEIYIYSVQLDTVDDMPYVDYISFVDTEGFVHEMLNTPENASIMKDFSLLLIRPENYSCRIDD